MDNLPPPPPAVYMELRPAAAPALPADLSGYPVWKRGTLKTRMLAMCWEDAAAPSGWQRISGFAVGNAVLPCFRPDMRRREGQRWAKVLEKLAFPNTPEQMQLAGQ